MLQKIENYKNAIMQLEDAVNCYLASPQDTLYRDGLIQRFEFTVELAWKSLREYLEDQGVVLSVISPRAVLKDKHPLLHFHQRLSQKQPEFARSLCAVACHFDLCP